MANTPPNSEMRTLRQALYEHDKEGIDVLLASPSRLLLLLNLLIAGILVTAVIWAFFAHADVIVTAPGTLVPKQDLRQVYAPLDGELRDIYVEVGAPVQAGDLIARIRARGAIEAASQALETKLKLDEARKEAAAFPQKRALLQQKAEALSAKLDTKARELERRQAEGLRGVTEAQRARLAESRVNLDQARRSETSARLEAERYQRLAGLPGGGGVSRDQVRQKTDAYLDAQSQRRSAEAKLATLEFEVNQAISNADSEFSSLQQEVAELRVQLASAEREMTDEEAKVEFKLRSAELAAEAADRLSFANFDQDNFLKIIAPVDGVITEIASRQRGAKVQSTQALVSIAPAGAERLVEVRIAEKDRGFLLPGQSVKLKFNAFPYRTYGTIEGRLDYIAPTATQGERNESPAYVGRVSLSRDSITTPQGEITLTYGMGATAEVVVRQRRFIDLALDPLRGLGP